MAEPTVPSPYDHRALERVCRHLKAALGADGVAVWKEDPRLVVATCGRLPQPGGAGVEALPVLYDDDPVAQLAWCGPADVSPHRGLVLAAADIVAPLVASIDTPTPPAAFDAPFGLVGVSAAIVQLRAAIPRAAATPVPVYVEGETGVGKELVARAIHTASGRRHGPFVAVNCAALSDELVDAELFGHLRGAFTGAAQDRRGLIEEAHGGTLFLDEVAELSPRAQAKLLRVLQEGEVRRVGDNHARTVDLRVVSATNRPLADEAAAGRFRADLRFRLDVVRLQVPPLRARRDDIPVLADHFWRDAMQRLRRTARLSRTLIESLRAYDWPGNARELQNTLLALAAAGPARGVVTHADLADHWPLRTPASAPSLHEARRQFEASYVREAFARHGQRPTLVAHELGVTRQGLAKLVARLGISADTSWTTAPGEARREAPGRR